MQRRDFVKLAAGASLSGVVAARRPAVADALRKVNVLEIPTDGAKAVLYAQKAGLFRKRGIDADIVAMGSGSAIYAAVIGGSADFGSGSLWPAYEAYAHGVPLRIVAPAGIYTSARPDGFLLVRKDSPIKTASDLNGKIVGGDSPEGISIVALRAWLDQHGGDGSSIRPLELKQTQQLEALDAGRIDAVILKPPYLTVAQESGKFRAIGTPYDSIAPRYLLSCWVATADFIAKNPDVVKAFVGGLAEAARYANTHQDQTVDMVAAFSGQDRTQLARGLRSVETDSATMAMLQAPLDLAVKYGVMDRKIDLNGILAPMFPLAKA
jgi:NitT/TauT family transport system substrate-binding protein